jgi:hypothetical protein
VLLNQQAVAVHCVYAVVLVRVVEAIFASLAVVLQLRKEVLYLLWVVQDD